MVDHSKLEKEKKKVALKENDELPACPRSTWRAVPHNLTGGGPGWGSSCRGCNPAKLRLFLLIVCLFVLIENADVVLSSTVKFDEAEPFLHGSGGRPS